MAVRCAALRPFTVAVRCGKPPSFNSTAKIAATGGLPSHEPIQIHSRRPVRPENQTTHRGGTRYMPGNVLGHNHVNFDEGCVRDGTAGGGDVPARNAARSVLR